MMTQHLTLTIGLPASGKTTWAVEQLKKDPDLINLNRDDLRIMLQGRDRYAKFTKFREDLVTDMMMRAAEDALKAGKSVVISDTNLDPNRNVNWLKLAQSCGVTYYEKNFTDVPYGVCIERDRMREFPVGQRVIEGMFNRYRDVWWPAPEELEGHPNAYIFDVDGTIAKMDGRSPFDWSKVMDDLPNTDIINVAKALKSSGALIIVCSGRDGSAERLTRKWMDEHGMPYDHFFIRTAGDSRKDYVIKEEIYRNHIEGWFNVRGVFDDRDQVVHLWRHLGLTCMQVNYGNF
jgi:predicted kinase